METLVYKPQAQYAAQFCKDHKTWATISDDDEYEQKTVYMVVASTELYPPLETQHVDVWNQKYSFSVEHAICSVLRTAEFDPDYVMLYPLHPVLKFQATKAKDVVEDAHTPLQRVSFSRKNENWCCMNIPPTTTSPSIW